MERIGSVGAAQFGPARSVRAAGAGFSVGRAALPQQAAAAPETSSPGLLGLQEAGADTPRDRRARQRGQAMLRGLGALQMALLGGGDLHQALEGLDALGREPAEADHPGLAAALSALRLRVRLELARHR